VREQRQPAIVIEFGYECPQGRHVAGHLPCPIGMAIRPCLAGGGIFDPVGMRGQVRLDRLDTDDMRVRTEIEDLC
jgi:hypothetical protein